MSGQRNFDWRSSSPLISGAGVRKIREGGPVRRVGCDRLLLGYIYKTDRPRRTAVSAIRKKMAGRGVANPPHGNTLASEAVVPQRARLLLLYRAGIPRRSGPIPLGEALEEAYKL